MSDLMPSGTAVVLDFTPAGTTAECAGCAFRVGPANTRTVWDRATEHYLAAHVTGADRERLGLGTG